MGLGVASGLHTIRILLDSAGIFGLNRAHHMAKVAGSLLMEERKYTRFSLPPFSQIAIWEEEARLAGSWRRQLFGRSFRLSESPHVSHWDELDNLLSNRPAHSWDHLTLTQYKVLLRFQTILNENIGWTNPKLWPDDSVGVLLWTTPDDMESIQVVLDCEQAFGIPNDSFKPEEWSERTLDDLVQFLAGGGSEKQK